MSSPPSSPWILIVEDVRDQAELWSDVCAEAGLNAMTASSGVQGYQRAVNTQPALILLDLMLPDIDGWEVCRRLKADDRTRNIPVDWAFSGPCADPAGEEFELRIVMN